MRHPHVETGGRYPILRVIAILWLVGAVVSLAYGIYQAISVLAGANHQQLVTVGGNLTSRIIGCVVWLAVTFFAVIANIAIAELIKLAMDVEQNTRMTATNTGATAFPPAATAASAAPPPGRDEARRRWEDESAEAALIRGH